MAEMFQPNLCIASAVIDEGTVKSRHLKTALVVNILKAVCSSVAIVVQTAVTDEAVELSLKNSPSSFYV